MFEEQNYRKNLGGFPKGFYWGAGTSAHQVEGGLHNNWTEWEKENAQRLAREAEKKFGYLPNWNDIKAQAQNPQNYISGRACDHYNRYEEDFDIAKSLGHNAHRFSIEWSRVEPREGEFDEKEIEHYRQVIRALRARGMEPFVTLWHWPLPLWLHDKGGVTNKYFPEYFSRYAERMAQALPDVKFWITLNEPDDIYSFYSYLTGTRPPQERSILKTRRVLKSLIKAHKNAYKIIHFCNSAAKVGFANNVVYFESYKNGFVNKILKFFAGHYWNFWFFRKTMPYNDFIGCNYYHHNRIRFNWSNLARSFKRNDNCDISDMGFEVFSEGIYHVLKNLKKYNLPIYITENGIADAKDEKRGKFIKEHIIWMHKAIQEGVDVRGYLYWSLLDNFEWDEGFWPRFGLVEVDYNTMERKIRPSAYAYAEICRTNSLIPVFIP